MKILAIESSCDETSAAVVERTEGGFEIRSNVIASQIETHRLYGGVVPEIASRAHVEAISRITYEALSLAGVGMEDIDAIGVTAMPGLIGALLVGVNFAKGLAAAYKKPLIATDHIKGHIAACYLNGTDIPKPPFVALAASGGHTSIYLVEDYTHLKVIGRTRDDAIGEAYDKVGRLLGLEYPAGAGFDRLARDGFIKATGDKESYYEAYKRSASYKDPGLALPSPALSDGTLDFSFSGLKTAAINLMHRYEQRGISPDRELFAARYTYEVTEAVAKKLKAALIEHSECDLALCGGVAANSHLRRRLTALAGELARSIYIPPVSLCGDNGAMIAAAAYYEYESGNIADSSLNASALDSIV